MTHLGGALKPEVPPRCGILSVDPSRVPARRARSPRILGEHPWFPSAILVRGTAPLARGHAAPRAAPRRALSRNHFVEPAGSGLLDEPRGPVATHEDPVPGRVDGRVAERLSGLQVCLREVDLELQDRLGFQEVASIDRGVQQQAIAGVGARVEGDPVGEEQVALQAGARFSGWPTSALTRSPGASRRAVASPAVNGAGPGQRLVRPARASGQDIVPHAGYLEPPSRGPGGGQRSLATARSGLSLRA
jgi:hypothetical protein